MQTSQVNDVNVVQGPLSNMTQVNSVVELSGINSTASLPRESPFQRIFCPLDDHPARLRHR